MQFFDLTSQITDQLDDAPDLPIFLKTLVGLAKELSGFHRVIIYQFDAAFNGKVITEVIDTSHTIDLYKGLHFPASDIPSQARELYKINRVRLLYDRELQTARIVCRTQQDLDVPLDMTHAYLRAMSPIHCKYLANMAVRSSMSISINAFNELWGLIACHSYGPHGMRVPFSTRKLCRFLGDAARQNIERLSYASRLQARKLINTAPTHKNLSGYIIASSDLLKLFDADLGLLSIRGETKIMGVMEQSHEALALLEYLRMRKLTSVFASQDIQESFPDLRYRPGFQVIAGLLYVPLSAGGNDFIIFLRKGQVHEVKWAGNPYEKVVRSGTAGYLEPRTSFQAWRETVVGKCREWTEEQIETAAVLCLVYGKFIEVWRQKEAALQNSRLTRLLLANSAHEVRTPLNAIINYLEIALEGSLDQETRDNLARSHFASKSLIYVINDLLDLTKAEEGQTLIKDEVFDLPLCVQEATSPFEKDARRKGIGYSVTLDPGLSSFVYGDGRRIRQAISNVTANAIAHTHAGKVDVDVFVSEVREKQAVVDIVVADTGVGMSTHQLDALFRDLEQVSSEEPDPLPSPEHPDSDRKKRMLGLGLAVVARTVRTMDGQLRLKSEPGCGSRFVVQLPFPLPDESPVPAGDATRPESRTAQSSNSANTVSVSLKPTPPGEITLIDRGSALVSTTEADRARAGTVSPVSRHSAGSILSLKSQSSHQSDADRLIHAIQTPLSLNDCQTSYFGTREDPPEQPVVGSLPSSVSPHTQRFTLTSPLRPWDEPGSAGIRDSKTLVRAIKVPDELQEVSPYAVTRGKPFAPLALEAVKQAKRSVHSRSQSSSATMNSSIFRTLIAEDEPLNVKILSTRLERAGHQVHHAGNGEECVTVYGDNPATFDVILMDMQMPIVDGLTSTKMIRTLEKTLGQAEFSKFAAMNGRVPIFAVSASLNERKWQTYVDAGFDGWILKPINFERLSTLLTGIPDSETRNSCLYAPGQWERGGWFIPSKDEGKISIRCREIKVVR